MPRSGDPGAGAARAAAAAGRGAADRRPAVPQPVGPARLLGRGDAAGCRRGGCLRRCRGRAHHRHRAHDAIRARGALFLLQPEFPPDLRSAGGACRPQLRDAAAPPCLRSRRDGDRLPRRRHPRHARRHGRLRGQRRRRLPPRGQPHPVDGRCRHGRQPRRPDRLGAMDRRHARRSRRALRAALRAGELRRRRARQLRLRTRPADGVRPSDDRAFRRAARLAQPPAASGPGAHFDRRPVQPHGRSPGRRARDPGLPAGAGEAGRRSVAARAVLDRRPCRAGDRAARAHRGRSAGRAAPALRRRSRPAAAGTRRLGAQRVLGGVSGVRRAAACAAGRESPDAAGPAGGLRRGTPVGRGTGRPLSLRGTGRRTDDRRCRRRRAWRVVRRAGRRSHGAGRTGRRRSQCTALGARPGRPGQRHGSSGLAIRRDETGRGAGLRVGCWLARGLAYDRRD